MSDLALKIYHLSFILFSCAPLILIQVLYYEVFKEKSPTKTTEALFKQRTRVTRQNESIMKIVESDFPQAEHV